MMGMTTDGATVENIIEAFQNVKLELLYKPAFVLLDMYPKKTKTLIQSDVRIPMFISELYTIAKIWQDPKCPSIGLD